MEANSNLPVRPADKNLFIAAAFGFPLLVLIGYFKSYYFSRFFEVEQVTSAYIHAHAVVMSVWVVYFAAQIALIRSKNVKLHRTFGLAGIALAAIVVVTGLAAAFDAHIVRRHAPFGINPHGFFIIPVSGMVLFVLFFAAAIYYRKRPAEHKSLMVMTAINFLPPAFARIPVVPPEFTIFWAFGAADLLALAFLGIYSWKRRRLNKTLLAAVLIFIVSKPLTIFLADTEIWLGFVTLLEQLKI